jgi:hypothetical protein
MSIDIVLDVLKSFILLGSPNIGREFIEGLIADKENSWEKKLNEYRSRWIEERCYMAMNELIEKMSEPEKPDKFAIALRLVRELNWKPSEKYKERHTFGQLAATDPEYALEALRETGRDRMLNDKPGDIDDDGLGDIAPQSAS